MNVREMVVTLAVGLAFLSSPGFARAQEQGRGTEMLQEVGTADLPLCGEYPNLTAYCQKEFNDWDTARRKYKDWVEKYGNFIVWEWGNTQVMKRSNRPATPAWLETFCAPVRWQADAGPVCTKYFDYLRFDWLNDPVKERDKKIESFTMTTQTTFGEQDRIMDFFLKSAHIDGVWTNSNNGPRSYGFIGMHMALAHIRRLYIWGPPGFILMKEPGQATRFRRSWGVDFFLGSPKVPWNDKRFKVYLTFAKLLSTAKIVENDAGFGSDMMGFSISLK